MKLLKQIVLPLGIVVVLIAGVTFVSHYLARPRSTEKTLFVENRIKLDDDGPEVVEADKPGRYESWCLPVGPEPVKIGLKSMSRSCTEVAITLFGKDEWQELWTLTSPVAAGLAASGPSGPACAEGVLGLTRAWHRRRLDPAPRWQVLRPEEPLLPTGEGGRPFLLRFSWNAAPPGLDEVGFELWTEESGQRQAEHFKYTVSFVPPFRLDVPTAQFRDLTGKDQKASVHFQCWSPTRQAFPLQVRLEKAGPSFECACRPLTDEERVAKEAQLREAEEKVTRVRSGYLVSVTAINAPPLELGPFERVLMLTAEPDDKPLFALVRGVARGEVKVGLPQDRDQIDLGPFKANKGASKMIPLTLEDDTLELLPDVEKPAFLEVQLKRGGANRWELEVQVPPGAVAGRLPRDSAVTLTVKGTPPRRLRIPVVGQGTQ